MIDYANKDKENIVISIEEFIRIEELMQNMQCIFHPLYAVDGKITLAQVNQLKAQGKEIIVNLDRNIFTDLVKVVRQGTLAEEDILKKIALLMAWAGINGIAIMPYDAIAENARKFQDNTEANAEMECFDFAFREMECKTWLEVVLRGKCTVAPTITEKYALNNTDDSQIDFCNESVDYLYHYAAMLHFVRIARSNESWEEQIKEFFQWYFDNAIVCQYVQVYVILYYANQYKVKLPKHAKSKEFTKVLEGCKNQARDLCYLSEWSKVYANNFYDEYEVFFATFDLLLGIIFTSCHKINDASELFSLFTNGKGAELYDFYNELCLKHKKIEIDEEQSDYCWKLVGKELQALRQEIDDQNNASKST